MSQGFQFDESSAKRVVNATRWVELHTNPEDGTTAPFARLAYETIEDSPNTGEIHVKILTRDRVITHFEDRILKYNDEELDDVPTGFKGECTPFGHYFYHDSPTPPRARIFRGVLSGMSLTSVSGVDGLSSITSLTFTNPAGHALCDGLTAYAVRNYSTGLFELFAVGYSEVVTNVFWTGTDLKQTKHKTGSCGDSLITATEPC